MFNPTLSICKGKQPEVVANKTLHEICEHIKTNADTAQTVVELRDLRQKNPKAYKKRKMSVLFNILTTGTFTRRNNSSLETHAHIISLDFDDIDIDVIAMKERLVKIESCCFAFVSPSGEGVKAFFRIKTETNQSNHRDAWETLVAMVSAEAQLQVADVDSQANALSQGCLVSHDPDAYFLDDPEPFDWVAYRQKIAPKRQNPRKNRLNLDPAVFSQYVQDAIDMIPIVSISREDWIAVGMGLHSDNRLLNGFEIWDAWSSKDAERYDQAEVRRSWDGFRSGAGRSLGTVFYLATEHGWSAPESHFEMKAEFDEGRLEAFGKAVDRAITGDGNEDDFDGVVGVYSTLSGAALQKAEPKLSEFLARARVGRSEIKRSLFKRAVRERKQGAAVDAVASVADPRIRVFLNDEAGDKSLNDLVNEIENHLPPMLSDPNGDAIYNKDEVLVRIQGGAVKLQSTTTMRYWLTGGLAFWEKRKKGLDIVEVRVRKAPTTIEETMIEMPSDHFPRLRGVVCHPIFLPDGSCHSTKGYDEGSQLYLTEDLGIDYDAIKTDDESVKKAKSLIFDDLLVDFNWSDESRDNYLAYLLTYPMRPFIGGGRVPVYVVDAPTRGIGKSKLIDIASLIWTGLPISKKAFPTGMGKEEEMRKLLHALAIEGHEALLFDNVDVELRSPNFSLAITSGVIGGRILGVTKTVDASFDTIVAVTGNNLVIAGDMDRRFYSSRIETDYEKPELRSGFKHANLEMWALDMRIELITSLLTLVKVWRERGSPVSDVSWGSFEMWTQTVGGILDANGMHAFLRSRGDDDTDEQIVWRTFVAAWYENHRLNEVGVKDLFDIASSADDADDEGMGLLDQYLGSSGDRGRRNRLGRLLSDKSGRIFGEYRIVKRRKKKNASRFALEHVVSGEDDEVIPFSTVVTTGAQLFDLGEDIRFDVLVERLTSDGHSIDRSDFDTIVYGFEKAVGTVVSGLLICGGSGDYHFEESHE